MNRDGKKVHLTMLLALAVGMFGFAFALVPLYNVFCEITGLNGKTATQAALLEEINSTPAPADQKVTIGFLGSAARGLPWEFRPLDNQLVVVPGEMNRTTFYVRNRSPKTVTGQAVPSVSPGQAALYLKKIECFCFEQQQLSPGEELEMGVSFVIDADIPPELNELTLSYTMFHIANLDAENIDHENMLSHQESGDE